MNKKILISFIILSLIFGIFLISSSEIENKISPYVYENLEKNEETRVIVEIKEPDSEKGIFIKNQKTAEEIELEKRKIKEDIEEKINEKIRHNFGNKIAVEISKEDLIELNNNPNVKSIIIDKPLQAFLQDSVPLVNASTVWPIIISNFNITGIDEIICILDSGINFTHPDLIGKNKTCIINCITEDCVENCSIADDNGHGTHVAGIAAANGGVRGVAVGANLIGVKVLNSAGSGNVADLDAGLDWCINNAEKYNISVISVSLGTNCVLTPQYCYDSYCDYDWDTTATRINNATSKNISVMIAAGNNGDIKNISAPSCIYNATTISATNKDDTIASYSNRNNLIDLVAPGTDITSTKNIGGHESRQGTSMATPHVAGAFAVIREFFRLQNNRVPTPLEILTILNSTGKQINDSAGNGLNYSRIDIYSALISNDSLAPSVNLTSSDNRTSNFNANLSFKCSANDVFLSNLSLYVWNSTKDIINITFRTIASINTEEEFSLNLSYGNYSWNCLAYDIKGKLSFGSSNFTITYDNIKPIINIINPADSSSYSSNSQSINFIYNVSDNYNIANCSLIVNNAISLTNSSITNFSENQVFTNSFSPGNYIWSVNCTDSAGNQENSSSRSLVITSPPVVISSSGGGGGSLYTIYTPSITETSNGYTKELSKNEKIQFVFFDATTKKHALTINEIKTDYVNITIRSDSVNLLLGIGQSIKINLTSADYYDLFIKLENIENNKAKITIQTIHEEIPKQKDKPISEASNESIESNEIEKNINYLISEIRKLRIFIILIIMISLISIILIVKKKNEKKPKKRKRFKNPAKNKKK